MAVGQIMIADDEPAVAKLVKTVAIECGYDANTVSSADELHERLGQRGLTHIFLDLSMPDLDGIEVMRYLSQIRCRARIVIFSGADVRVRDAARRLGSELGLDMAGALPKPVRLAELRTLLNNLKPQSATITAEAISDAITGGEMTLEYQPKVSLPAYDLAGVEALVRWQQPNGKLIMPGDFLPVIEATEVMERLTWAVVEIALDQIRSWREIDFDCPVSINLSTHSLSDLKLADKLAAKCAERDVSPNLLILELTETASIQDQLSTIDVLTRLRLKGFGLSIDDFGTGFSSVAQLHRLPFSELKIDRCFVSELNAGGDAAVIVRAMIDLAHNLGISVCAEGVEDEATIATLHHLSCNTVQGYHISRPMLGAVIPPWAARKHVSNLSAVSSAPIRSNGGPRARKRARR